MVTAINIQSQVGGNLATVLDSIAFTIRERIRIIGEIRTLTAMQRYSGYVITLLPVGLGGILFLISPTYIGAHVPNPTRRSSACRPGRHLLHRRLHQHGHRLLLHPTHRRHQGVIPMPTEVIIAGLAAAAVLLITFGVDRASAEGRRPAAARSARRPAQERSKEYGAAGNRSPSGSCARSSSACRAWSAVGRPGGLIARDRRQAGGAGYPGGLRGADWMGVKVLATIVFGDRPSCSGCSSARPRWASCSGSGGAGLRLHGAGILARRQGIGSARSTWSCSCPTPSTC